MTALLRATADLKDREGAHVMASVLREAAAEIDRLTADLASARAVLHAARDLDIGAALVGVLEASDLNPSHRLKLLALREILAALPPGMMEG